MDRTLWIIFVLIGVLTLGGLVLLSRKDNVDVSGLNPAKAVSETTTAIGDHVYGKKSSKVVLIEYGDFQCPSCGAAFPQLKTIRETYKDKIAFIFRNFPITTSRPNALAAAAAAEAAGLQGKFWEMHDKLYENQMAWSDNDARRRTDAFAGYAKDIGLDVARFKKDLSDPKVSAKISRDRAFGKKLAVDSTPALYLGSEKLTSEEVSDLGQAEGKKLMDKLDRTLKASGVEPPSRP